MITVKRERLTIPGGCRLLAVSDIHGHGHFLKRLLEKAGFCGDDELVIVGDMIEKGPYSLETLQYIMELDRLPDVHVAAGNVDSWQQELIGSGTRDTAEMLFQVIHTARERWGGSLFLDFCEEMGRKIPEFNPLIDVEKHIISIDGGCGLKRDGQLNCLIIADAWSDADEVSWVSYGGFPLMTALDGQEEQRTRISIQYTDNRVELLEPDVALLGFCPSPSSDHRDCV